MTETKLRRGTHVELKTKKGKKVDGKVVRTVREKHYYFYIIEDVYGELHEARPPKERC